MFGLRQVETRLPVFMDEKSSPVTRPRTTGRRAAAVLGALAVWAFCYNMIGGSSSPFSASSGATSLNDAINNQTLGFEKIYVVNMPTRHDNRDMMTLAAAASGMQIEFIQGVGGDSVPDKGLPIGVEGMSAQDPNQYGPRGLWITDVNILQHMVVNNIGSALIMEDDADWDTRLREQLHDFSKASRYLGAVAARENTNTSTHARDFGKHNSSTFSAPRLSFNEIDNVAATSPYGDNWDILWLGHCGVRMPHNDGFSDNVTHHTYLAKHDDPTAAPFSQQSTLANSVWNIELLQEPDHTRFYHHAVKGVCLQGWAISLRGARRLLYELEFLQNMTPIDIAMKWFCDNNFSKQENICISTQPSLFQQYKPRGTAAKDSNMHGDNWNDYIREVGTSQGIQWSVRNHALEVMEGQTVFQDAYVDTVGERKWSEWSEDKMVPSDWQG